MEVNLNGSFSLRGLGQKNPNRKQIKNVPIKKVNRWRLLYEIIAEKSQKMQKIY